MEEENQEKEQAENKEEQTMEEDSPKVNEVFNERLTSQKSNKGKIITWVVVIIIIIAGLIGGIKIFTSSGVNLGQPTPTSTPTEVPTPTPNPLNRSQWSFEILNGSGVTGLAKKIAGQLTDLGYSVVKTGNAEDDLDETTILVSEDLQDKVSLVIVDLKDIVKIASMGGVLKDSTASARIILGKDLK